MEEDGRVIRHSDRLIYLVLYFFIAIDESKRTMALMARQDHEANINVLIAHDETLEVVLKEINGGQDSDFIRLKGTKEEHQLFKNRKSKEKGEI